jgi:hypothetical protein
MNSTHCAILGASAIVCVALYVGTPLEQITPIIVALGSYAGISQWKRNKNAKKTG